MFVRKNYRTGGKPAMKAFRSVLALVAVCVFCVVACDSPSEPDQDDLDQMLGRVPQDADADNVCGLALCATDGTLQSQCETFVSSCLPVATEAQCVGGAWVICNG
jgi:hypothetical protein